MLHILAHLILPPLIARLAFPKRWKRVALIMLATMLVDLDHLLADPIYDPMRCSIGFHPLHQPPAIITYGAMSLWPPTLPAGLGLLIHMGLDGLDCLSM